MFSERVNQMVDTKTNQPECRKQLLMDGGPI